MHINLDYDLDLEQRLEFAHNLNLDLYKSKELELIANYILYMDNDIPKSASKHVKSRTQCATNEQLSQQKEITNNMPKYTNPKPIMHTENPIIEQYADVIAWLNQIITNNPNHPDLWKLKKWKLQHNLDMGIVNSLLYPMPSSPSGFAPYPDIDLDQYIDLTNSFHIAKLIEFYSELRQSDEHKLWIEWIEQNIIEKTAMYDWQKHLLKRRIDKTKQVTIGRELGEFFGKIVTPSTMSQAMRTLYRQIAITAERELYAYNMRDYLPAWKKCKHCGEMKLIKFDFYEGKSTCKQCGKDFRERKKANG